MRAKIWLAVSLVILLTVGTMYAQSLAAGWTLTTSATLAGCPIVSSFGLCGVTTTPPSVNLSLNGGAYVQLFPFTGSAGVTSFNGRVGAVLPVNGDYSLSGMAGTISASQLPAQSTCTVTYSNFVSNGLGGGSFVGVNTSCK